MKTNKFSVLAVSMMLAMGVLFFSCANNTKGNVSNDDKNEDSVQQSAAPEKSEREQDLENAYKALSRISYTNYHYDKTKDNNTYIKDGVLSVRSYYGLDGSTPLISFGLELQRYAYIDGVQVPYNPQCTANDLSIFVMKEIVFILTKKSLGGDPIVRKRYKEIDISQYLYYLVYGNDDANEFVKERVKMHYEVAMEQMLDEINYVYEVTNNSASNFKFRFEPSIYNNKYAINMRFDDNGYLVVDSSPWF